MKKFYWLPKLIVVKLKEDYFDGTCLTDKNGMTTCTSTFAPSYYWVGKECYKWLWFEYEKDLYENRDFEVWNNTVTLCKTYPQGTLVSIDYNHYVPPNRNERRSKKKH